MLIIMKITQNLTDLAIQVKSEKKKLLDKLTINNKNTRDLCNLVRVLLLTPPEELAIKKSTINLDSIEFTFA